MPSCRATCDNGRVAHRGAIARYEGAAVCAGHVHVFYSDPLICRQTRILAYLLCRRYGYCWGQCLARVHLCKAGTRGIDPALKVAFIPSIILSTLQSIFSTRRVWRTSHSKSAAFAPILRSGQLRFVSRCSRRSLSTRPLLWLWLEEQQQRENS